MSRRALCATLWLGLLCGCTTAPKITPIGSGESVTIEVVRKPQADGAVEIRNQAVAEDGKSGAAAGMVVGGLWGLACGPFMFVCIPVGAVAGGTYGGVAGVVVGMTGSLSAEKAAQLRERLDRLRQSRDLLGELRQNITDRARRHWNMDSAQPKFAVTVELQDLVLTSTRDERIGFAMRVLLTVRPGDGQQPAMPNQKLYEYVSPSSSLAVWLDERSDFLDTSLSSASQQLATQLVAELAQN